MFMALSQSGRTCITRMRTLKRVSAGALRLTRSTNFATHSQAKPRKCKGKRTGTASTGSNKGGGTLKKVGFLIFSSIVGGTAYLGAWQTKRYFWKIEVMAQRETKLASEARSVDNFNEFILSQESPSESKGEPKDVVEFTPVKTRGVFLHAQTILLGPRSAPKHSNAFNNDYGEKSGYNIITPLLISDQHGGENREEIVWVNRGWVANSKHKDIFTHLLSGSKKKGKDENESGTKVTSVTGILRSGEGQPSSFVPGPELAKRHFFSLDLPAMVQLLKVR